MRAITFVRGRSLAGNQSLDCSPVRLARPLLLVETGESLARTSRRPNGDWVGQDEISTRN